ncbi:MAG: hypothetical protein QF724_08060 [Planctomycetota bacterium]|nr:hypothetical protein [Planctomycetota bacterium]MDP6520785.1 hypothetical protein [Planctomycetota bacterium]MDP6838874.1 hypothetical protein [Planctomycetota bacterium]MDP6954827.1 hypothetical protein [Planctomycetota bacterium]
MATRKLITESCVGKLPPGGSLHLEPGTIVTPAARDLAFSRGVRLVEGGASAGDCAGASGTESDCMWHRVLATDGDYIVQVRAGRAVLSRLTPEGPVAFGIDLLENHS